MPEFEQRQDRHGKSRLVSQAEPGRLNRQLARAADPVVAQRQNQGNQVAQRFAQSCPLHLPSPALCPFGGICHACPVRLQAKLTINEPGDKYEKEADRVAEQVMRMPEPRLQRQVAPEEVEEETLQAKPLAEQVTPLVQRQVEPEEEEEEEPVQTKTVEDTQVQRQEEEPEEEEEEPVQAKRVTASPVWGNSHLGTQIRSLQGGGRPLSSAERYFFEPRFGRDFDQVRVHDDARAAETAQALNARAFTLGHDIVVGAGQYAPDSGRGRRLLAHELAHVIQQAPGIRRAPARAAVRKDVVLLMSPGYRAEATTLAPGAKMLRVSSASQMAKKLRTVKHPIKRLVIISHSLASGDLGFEKGSNTTFVRPAVLAKTLTGTVPAARAPELIDFRGCSLGSSPAGMEKIRVALGAGAAIAGNCFMITHIQGPVAVNSTNITKASQVTKGRRQAFNTGFQMLIDSFGKAKDCILDKSKSAYFRAKGKLVAQWASPHFGTHWDDRKSKCYKDLTIKTVDPSKVTSAGPGLAGHCKLIRIEKKP